MKWAFVIFGWLVMNLGQTGFVAHLASCCHSDEPVMEEPMSCCAEEETSDDCCASETETVPCCMMEEEDCCDEVPIHDIVLAPHQVNAVSSEVHIDIAPPILNNSVTLPTFASFHSTDYTVNDLTVLESLHLRYQVFRC